MPVGPREAWQETRSGVENREVGIRLVVLCYLVGGGEPLRFVVWCDVALSRMLPFWRNGICFRITETEQGISR